MPLPRQSGILLHPSSLPGPHGAGDLGAAAYHFVDWLAAGEQSLWQVLPLGGVGPGNSPYMSPSAFAGNELFIDLERLLAAGWLRPSELEPRPDFSAHQIDYAASPGMGLLNGELRSLAVQALAGAQQRAAPRYGTCGAGHPDARH